MNEFEINTFLTKIYKEFDEYAYRYIYDLYLMAEFPEQRYGLYFKVIVEQSKIIIQLKSQEFDNQYITFYTEDERVDFLQYLKKKYCGEKYPSMQVWHQQQMDWAQEDLYNWTS